MKSNKCYGVDKKVREVVGEDVGVLGKSKREMFLKDLTKESFDEVMQFVTPNFSQFQTVECIMGILDDKIENLNKIRIKIWKQQSSYKDYE